jgi:hypothetical protein
MPKQKPKALQLRGTNRLLQEVYYPEKAIASSQTGRAIVTALAPSNFSSTWHLKYF